MKPLQLGVIGCGEHSGHHIKHMDVPFNLLGVFDPDPENADLATRWVADRPANYGTIEELLANPDIEAVIIGSPDKFHPEHLQLAVRAGKHVFIEKPLAIDRTGYNDVCASLERARTDGLVVSSCHPRRFDPAYMGVKQLLPGLQARLGSPVSLHLDFTYHKPSDEWKHDRSLLLDHCPHEIDCMHFFFGMADFRAYKLGDGHAGYSVAGVRKDGISFLFTGTRALESKVYAESISIRFERGDILQGTQSGKLFVSNHETGKTQTLFANKTGYASRLSLLNQNFFETVRGTAKGYLTTTDMLVNTGAAIQLVKKGFVEYTF